MPQRYRLPPEKLLDERRCAELVGVLDVSVLRASGMRTTPEGCHLPWPPATSSRAQSGFARFAARSPARSSSCSYGVGFQLSIRDGWDKLAAEPVIG